MPINVQLSSRISWVDVARGIGILLVLYGHAIDHEINRYFIYAFHMPLFFFLSGIVFKPVHDKSLWSVIVKNIKQIIVPYFLFALVTFALDIFLMHPNGETPAEINKQLYGILYGNGNQGYLAFNVALWFLPCLFVSKIALAALTKWVARKQYILICLILISVIGYLTSILFHNVRLPFGIESALTAIVFLGAGYLWAQSERLKHMLTQKQLVILFFAAVSTLVFATLNFHFYGHQIDMRVNRLNNYFFFYAGAFSGITVCLITSMLIKKNQLLEYLGRHSMLLFVWHTVIYAFFRTHAIPPVKIPYVNPPLYLLMATSIILFGQLLFSKLKLSLRYVRR
jgi:acyltransferase